MRRPVSRDARATRATGRLGRIAAAGAGRGRDNGKPRWIAGGRIARGRVAVGQVARWRSADLAVLRRSRHSFNRPERLAALGQGRCTQVHPEEPPQDRGEERQSPPPRRQHVPIVGCPCRLPLVLQPQGNRSIPPSQTISIAFHLSFARPAAGERIAFRSRQRRKLAFAAS